MITEKAIASQCNQRSFTRGRAIASSDRNILTKQVRYDAEESVISAFVASSSGWDDRYRTSVILDEEADEVLDYSCTCPAFREYAGMCTAWLWRSPSRSVPRPSWATRRSVRRNPRHASRSS